MQHHLGTNLFKGGAYDPTETVETFSRGKDRRLRDAVRSHFVHLFGEALKDVEEDQEGSVCDRDGKHP